MKYLVFLIVLAFGLKGYGQTAEEYFDRANKKSHSKNFNGAIEDYTKAIELDSNYQGAYYNRGVSKKILQDYNGAIDDFNKSIRLARRNLQAHPYYNRGYCKYQLKDYKGAIDDFTKNLELTHGIWFESYIYRGKSKYELADKDGACTDWKDAFLLTRRRQDSSLVKEAEDLISKHCR